MSARAFETAWDFRNQRVLAVRNVVDLTLLNNGRTTKGQCQLLAQLGRVLLLDVDTLDLGQTAELDDVGCENAVFVSLDEI